MVANIDGFIESKVPGYKETIKDKVNDTAMDLLLGLLSAYAKFNNYMYENLEFEDYLNFVDKQAKIVSGVSNAVNKVKDTAGSIKDKTSDKLDSIKDKADNWYQNWKNN